MKLAIVGLGLIGTAYAHHLSESGHTVLGLDASEAHFKKVLNDQAIKGPFDWTMSDIECVILATPVKATQSLLKTHAEALSQVPLVTDVTGLKAWIPSLLTTHPNLQASWISHHPMAGGSGRGPATAKTVDFTGKTVIAIHSKASAKAHELFAELMTDLKFDSPVFMTPDAHDAAITLNSHMPHVLAATLIKQTSAHTREIAGPSMQTIERFAAMNPTLWAELFTLNTIQLNGAIEEWIKSLRDFQSHLSDQAALATYLKNLSATLHN